MLTIGGYGLQLIHKEYGPIEKGMYIVKSEEYFYALRIGGEEATVEAYPIIFCIDNTTARMILESVMSIANIYRYVKKAH